VFVDGFLDFDAVDIHASRDDDLVALVEEINEPFVVDTAYITGPEPAVGNRLRRPFGTVVTLRHLVRALANISPISPAAVRRRS